MGAVKWKAAEKRTVKMKGTEVSSSDDKVNENGN